MRRGFLLAGPTLAVASAQRAVATAASARPDNLIAAWSVKERRAAGATSILRIEADFVTCSQ